MPLVTATVDVGLEKSLSPTNSHWKGINFSLEILSRYGVNR